MDKVLTHLGFVEELLVCPIGIEENPDDLSKLRCGHAVSLRAWEENVKVNPHKEPVCPMCKGYVEEVGPILPMDNIRQVIGEIKENCGWLQDTLSWESGSDDHPYAQPPFIRKASHQTSVYAHDESQFASPYSDSGRSSLEISRGTKSPSLFSDSANSQLASGSASLKDEILNFKKPLLSPVPDSLTDQHIHSPGLQQHRVERRLSQKSSTTLSDSRPRSQDLSSRKLPSATIASTDQISSHENRSRNHIARHPESTTYQLSPVSRASTLFGRARRRDSQASTLSEAPSVAHASQPGLGYSMSFVNLGDGKTQYQGTAISSTCLIIALIDLYSFTVLSVPRVGNLKTLDDFPVICYGANDGRFGNSKGFQSDIKSLTPKYTRAVMSDEVLCIACEEKLVEIRDARTGALLRRIPSSPNCNLAISPNGELLALATHLGELKVFTSGPYWDFDTEPLWVVKDTEKSGQLRYVKCMAFSPNSNYLSTCTYGDNIIRTYKLSIATNAATLMSIHRPDSMANPGITDLSLYVPSIDIN